MMKIDPLAIFNITRQRSLYYNKPEQRYMLRSSANSKHNSKLRFDISQSEVE
jgi:hypothetical protein